MNRKQLKLLAGNKCVICNSSKNLEIHHIIPKQKGINNSSKNLRVLCRECHRKIKIPAPSSIDREIISLHLSFTKKEYDALKKVKEATQSLNWRDFFLTLIEYGR